MTEKKAGYSCEYTPAKPRFQSFVQGGFECSTHRLIDGRRLDMIAATRHDVLVKQDYGRLVDLGIKTVREGLRWHLIEHTVGRYDFASIIPTLDAADQTGIETIIDLFHYGWPDEIDIFSQRFIDSFAELAHGFARLLRRRGILNPNIAPVNEISFVCWAGGDVAYLNPFARGRGNELKRQLVRAGVSAARAFLSELPQTRLVWPEPVIHIAGDTKIPGDQQQAEAYRLSMFEAWDMISGRREPELGGSANLLQTIGVNFYDRNEWLNNGHTLQPGESLYRPFHAILVEVWNRYRVPLFVSETGTENSKRPEWFRYISEQVRQAMHLGADIHGVCLYPILNHPGWDDDRHCYNGLFDYADASGLREIYKPLAVEIARQQNLNTSVYRG